MYIYRIVAIFFTIPPLTLNLPYLYFPLSIMGVVLYALTIFLDQKKEMLYPLDLILLINMIISAVSNKPLSYHFAFTLFLIVQYIKILTQSKSAFIQIFGEIGFATTLLSLFTPPFISSIARIILTIIMIKFYHEIKKNIPIAVSENTENSNITIPQESDRENHDKNYNFIIPHENNSHSD
ncbi:MAG: hypothetical protein ACRCTQ_03675 [Brevinemataceae bacterium]